MDIFVCFVHTLLRLVVCILFDIFVFVISYHVIWPINNTLQLT